MKDCLIKNAVNFSLNKFKNKIIQLGTIFYVYQNVYKFRSSKKKIKERALFIRNGMIGRKRKKIRNDNMQ